MQLTFIIIIIAIVKIIIIYQFVGGVFRFNSGHELIFNVGQVKRSSCSVLLD